MIVQFGRERLAVSLPAVALAAATIIALTSSLWRVPRFARATPTPAPPVAVAMTDSAVDAALDRRIAELDLENVPLSKALDRLRSASGVHIVVNWQVLEAAGIQRQTPVTCRARQAKTRRLLSLVLADASRGKADLVCEVQRGTVVITTQEDLDRNTTKAQYDIRDMLELPKGTGAEHANDQADREAAVELIELIKDTVECGTWGRVAQIEYASGQLTVTAPARHHPQIESLLEKLRETRFIGVELQIGVLRQGPAGRADNLGVEWVPLDQPGAGNVRYALLDDEQARRLNSALADATVLQSLRTTVFNAQSATAEMVGQPTIEAGCEAVRIQVQPVVSADRKWVSIHLGATLIEPEPQPGPVNAVRKGTMRTCHLSVKSVSVPDQSSLLLAGWTQSSCRPADDVLVLVRPRIIPRMRP